LKCARKQQNLTTKICLNKLLEELSKKENFVFLETAHFDDYNRYSYLFKNPLKIISCYNLYDVKPALKRLDKILCKGFFAAGFISYEAGFAFEAVLENRKHYDFPLLWFGIFENPTIFDHRRMEFEKNNMSDNYSIYSIKQDILKKDYIDSIEKIKSHIEKGHTYQVNRTFKLNFSFRGNPENIFLALRQSQKVSYSAFIRFAPYHILSFSPELFFRKEKANLQTKPMKGTMERGRFFQEDIKNAATLYNCQKNRSENIMILDLLRNDLGKIAQTGSVATKKIFEVEKYKSLFQMTSTAEAITNRSASLYGLLKAMFPSGSVTGAPKIRTMQIINDIEKLPRKIYTGSIGFITPNKDCVFNVAIRTLLLDSNTKKGEMGIGSGIVYDSNPKKEYQECMLKSKFLTDKYENFKLIETILWKPVQGYELINLHMQRLSESAAYFNYKYDADFIIESLKNATKNFNKEKRYRVRILLNEDGSLDIKHSMIYQASAGRVIAISSAKTNSADKWLYHKTTNRHLYNSEYYRYKKLGFFDVLFKNEKGQITEGAISNIFIKKDNAYYTPPIECGVLNGVYRRYLIQHKRLNVVEKVLYKQDLINADGIIMTNAIRGMIEVKVCENNIKTKRYYVYA
jgi:para-aminobenzoate synthetase / 4-amino-4-deoxychorismate lyase